MVKRGAPKGPFSKFLFVDLLVVFFSLALAFLIQFQEIRPENISVYVPLLPLIAGIRVASLFTFRLYDFSRQLTYFDLIYFSFWAMLAAHGVELLLLLYLRTFGDLHGFATAWNFIPSHWLEELSGDSLYQVSRNIIALNFALSWAFAAGWRILYLRRRRRWAYDRTRLLIVGAGELGDSVSKDIQQYSRLGHEVVGLVDDDLESAAGDAKVLGKMGDLPNLVEQYEIDEIIVASRRAARDAMLDILTLCRSTGRQVHLLPELYEVTIGQVSIGQVAGIPLISVNRAPLTEWGLVIKRALDITVASAGLLALLPFLPLIAFAIKLGGRGPIFYRQKRVGMDGKPFIIYKFRTMQVDAERRTGPVHSHDDDPRVTAVGRILRRLHVDELPQFFNVLRGDMSLVGPRPERPHFVKAYCETLPAYRLREQVRPGLTGLAQIHGFYNSPVEHKLRYDLAYINNISFLLDIKILFNTLRVVVSGRGTV